MKNFLVILLQHLIAIFCIHVANCVPSSAKVQTVYSWKHFEFDHLPHSEYSYVDGFHYYNRSSIYPTAISYHQPSGCFFLPIPRRAPGVPATIAYFNINEYHNTYAPHLRAFPTYEDNYAPGWFGVNDINDRDYQGNIHADEADYEGEGINRTKKKKKKKKPKPPHHGVEEEIYEKPNNGGNYVVLVPAEVITMLKPKPPYKPPPYEPEYQPDYDGSYKPPYKPKPPYRPPYEPDYNPDYDSSYKPPYKPNRPPYEPDYESNYKPKPPYKPPNYEPDYNPDYESNYKPKPPYKPPNYETDYDSSYKPKPPYKPPNYEPDYKPDYDTSYKPKPPYKPPNSEPDYESSYKPKPPYKPPYSEPDYNRPDHESSYKPPYKPPNYEPINKPDYESSYKPKPPNYPVERPSRRAYHFTSIYYTTMNLKCSRLFFVDSGMLQYPKGNVFKHKPIIWAFDIYGCDQESLDQPPALKVIIPDRVYKSAAGFAAFSVDVYGNCNEFAIYMANTRDNTIIVYDNVKQDFWYFKHETFKPGSERSYLQYGLPTQDPYNLGILSIALGRETRYSYRDVFYAPGSSYGLFKTSTKILKDKYLAPGSPTSSDFSFIGYRGPNNGAIIGYDDATEVLFSVHLMTNKLTCWNTNAPLSERNVVTLFSDLQYGVDFLIDSERNLWFMLLDANSETIGNQELIYGAFYRLYRVPLDYIIKGTACDSRRVLL
ncbi:uncharacterized protein LOC129788091 [Lutzomyia longipalpis]|uniref:uncharacterized protein LOC129788091 n=1 Tax=Lutzomyia longipalpis TaxID=7200 RepID=UPI002484438E|nr:uncharacterized protein LOC129788091 [Lutzomyia longipalpis]